MTTMIGVLVFVAMLQLPPNPAQSAPPPCAVSDDPTYGLTLANPVPIGGGAMYVAARARRYLPFKFTQARPADFPLPPLPREANPAENRLLLQVLIDLDGRLQRLFGMSYTMAVTVCVALLFA
jgi:hypothetical protein